MTPKDAEKWLAFRTQQESDTTPSRNREWVAQVVRFALAWADAMELQIAGGASVAACAERLSYEIDEKTTQGLTLMMFQAAVTVLHTHWAYADQLRDWHNQRFAPARSDPSTFGDRVVDCASVNTAMGQAALIATYREVMRDEKAYKRAVDKAVAAIVLQAITDYYREQGVVA